MTTDGRAVSRRTMIKGLAWSVPVVAVATAVPFAAASGGTTAPSWFFQYVVVESLQPGTLQIRLQAGANFSSGPFPDHISLSIDVQVWLGDEWVDGMTYVEVPSASAGGTILTVPETLDVGDLTSGTVYKYIVDVYYAADSDNNDLPFSSTSGYTNPMIGHIEVI